MNCDNCKKPIRFGQPRVESWTREKLALKFWKFLFVWDTKFFCDNECLILFFQNVETDKLHKFSRPAQGVE